MQLSFNFTTCIFDMIAKYKLTLIQRIIEVNLSNIRIYNK